MMWLYYSLKTKEIIYTYVLFIITSFVLLSFFVYLKISFLFLILK